MISTFYPYKAKIIAKTQIIIDLPSPVYTYIKLFLFLLYEFIINKHDKI